MSAQISSVVLNSPVIAEEPLSTAQRSDPVAAIKSIASAYIASHMANFNDNVDDFLFDLAGKTKDENLHYLYLDTISRLRNKRDLLRSKFIQNFEKLFDDSFAPAANAPQTTRLDAAAIDKLLLSGNDDLEAVIAVKSLAAKVHESLATQVAAVDSVFTQLSKQHMNPFTPIMLFVGWKEAVDALNLSLKSRFIVYKLFSKYLLSDLRSLYENILAELESRDITPRAAQTIAPEQPKADALSSGEFNVDSFTRELIIKRIVEILSAASKTSGQQLPAEAAHKVIIEGLSLMQGYVDVLSPNAASVATNGSTSSTELIGLFSRLLGAAHDEEELPQSVHDTIDLVRVMLDITLVDDRLDGEIRKIIQSIQIPLLKAAFIDKSFLDDKQHPARRLLDSLVNIGIAINSKSELDRKTACTAARKITARVIAEFAEDIFVIEEIVDSSPLFQHSDSQRKSAVAVKPSMPSSSISADENKLHGRRIAAPFREFLTRAWAPIMTHIRETKGTNDPQWSSALQVIDDLAVIAQVAQSQQRQDKILEIVPKLLCNLQTGLCLAPYDRQLKEQLFNQLLGIHARAIQAHKARQFSIKTKANKQIAKEAAR